MCLCWSFLVYFFLAFLFVVGVARNLNVPVLEILGIFFFGIFVIVGVARNLNVRV